MAYKPKKLRGKKTEIYYRNRDYVRSRKELGGGCCICGEGRLPCLDFHHKDPNTKKFSIVAMHNYSLRVIDEEINKCMLVCSNCHRVLHAKLKLKKIKDKEKNEFLPLFNILT